MAPTDPRFANWRAELAAVRERSRKAILQYELGQLHEQHGDPTSAIECYQAARSNDSTFRLPLFALIRLLDGRGEGAGLLDLFTAEARVATTPEAEASALVDQATLLEDKLGREGQSRALYERALSRAPAFGAAALMLELHLRRHGDERGLGRLLEARARHVQEPMLRRLLEIESARHQERSGDVDGAIDALRAGTSSPLLRWRLLGELEDITRRHERFSELADVVEMKAEEAEAWARGEGTARALSAGSLPTFSDEASARAHGATCWLDGSLQRNRLGDLEAALANVDRALALLPNDLLLHRERLSLLERAGDLEAVQRAARSMVERCGGPHTASLHLRVAEVARRLDQGKARTSSLRAAVAADPGSVAAAALLSADTLAGGRFDDHLAQLRTRSEAADPEDRALLLWEGAQVCADLLGDRKGALSLFEQAVAATEDPAERMAILREMYGLARRAGAAAARGARDGLLKLPLEPAERSFLHHEQYLCARQAHNPESCAAMLDALVGQEAPPHWAPEAARIDAARGRDLPRLARAHLVLGQRADTEDTRVAHLAAAARALAMTGELGKARIHLEDALQTIPGHAYANALLEEVLRCQGNLLDASALIRRTAEAGESARFIEPLLLRAGAAAERAGSPDVAAQAYRQACATAPDSIAPAHALLRLARKAEDRALELEALEVMAGQEAGGGQGGRATLALGEHHDLVTGDAERAKTQLRATLPHPTFGPAASIAILCGPHEEELHRQALERLIADAHGPDALSLRRTLGALLLESNAPPRMCRSVVEQALEHRPDSRWARYAQLRLSDGSLAQGAGRAEALRALAMTTSDPRARAELLLLAKWTLELKSPQEESQRLHLLEELDETCPDQGLRALAHDENVGPGSVELDPDLCMARAGHASKSHRGPLMAAAGRAFAAKGRSAEAVLILKNAVDADDEDLASWEALRVAAHASEDWGLLARTDERLAADCKEAHRAALLAEAAACYMDHLDQPARAEHLLWEVLKIEPTHGPAHDRLREITRTGGDEAALLELVDRRLSMTDDSAELLELYSEQARLRRSAGDDEGTVASLRNLLVLDPAHARGLAELAEALIRLERWPEAVDALKAVACVDLPAQTRMNARWAAARYLTESLGDPAGALSQLQIIERMGFADEAVLARMAHLAERAGDHEEAVRTVTQAAALTDGVERARYERRAGVLLVSALRNLSAGIEAYRRALSAAPTDVDSAQALSELLDRGARRRLAAGFQDAVRIEMRSRPTDLEPLRKLRRSASWNDDIEYERITLQAIDLSGTATAEERLRLEELEADAPRHATGSLSTDALGLLETKCDARELTQWVSLASEPIAAMEGLDTRALGVGRRNVVKPDVPSGPRDEVMRIAGIFGVEQHRFYIGGRDTEMLVALPAHGKPPTWVVGEAVSAPLTTEQRFDVGQQAMASRLGMGTLAGQGPERMETILRGLLQVADVSVEGAGPGVDDCSRDLRKALPRGTRKSLTQLGTKLAVSPEALTAFCDAMWQATLRAGLIASGDLRVALTRAVGGDPCPKSVEKSRCARELLSFALSESYRDLRRDLGLDRSTAEAEERRSGEYVISAVQSPSGFFGESPGPASWTVSITDLLDEVRAATDSSTQVIESARPRVGTPMGGVERVALIEELASGKGGAPRARLLTSAAEILSATTEGRSRAAALVAEAAQTAPDDIVALRFLRRDATRRGAFADVVALLQREAELPITGEERGLIHGLASTVLLVCLGDHRASVRAREQALAARPRSGVAALLLAMGHLSDRERTQGYATLERASRGWDDPRLSAALLVECALAQERESDTTRARFLFKRASDLDPSALDALLGLARTARTQRSLDDAVDSLSTASDLIHDPVLIESFRWAAARICHLGSGRPNRAFSLLSNTTTSPAVEACAHAAEAIGDQVTLSETLAGCAAANRRTDRALFLLWRAEVLADDGNTEEAREALREATHADQTLPAVRVTAEALARQTGDARWLARLAIAEGSSPTVASARAALVPDAADQERRLLGSEDPGTSTRSYALELAIDAALASGDEPEATRLFRLSAERADGERATGKLIALADLTSTHDGRHEARLLREIRSRDDTNVIALRGLADGLAAAPLRRAALWLHEASGAVGARAAFAATTAGRIIDEAGGNSKNAYRTALRADPSYGPALWALEAAAQKDGDGELLRDVLQTRANQAATPHAAAHFLIRAAFVEGGPAETEGALLTRAAELLPEDSPLIELRMRTVCALDPEQQGELLLSSAEGTPEEWARALQLRAAWAFAQAGDPSRAAAVCRGTLPIAEGPDVFAEHLLDRVEPAAGQLTQALERTAFEARSATDDVTRALALQRLASLEERRGGEPAQVARHLLGILESHPGHVPTLRGLERQLMCSPDDRGLADVEERIARLGSSRDALAHARLSVRLRRRCGEPMGATLTLLRDVFDYAEVDLWLARQLEAAARATDDARLLGQALSEIADLLDEPRERLAASLRAAEATAKARGASVAANRLAREVGLDPTYPVARELLAELRAQAGTMDAAVDSYQRAAETASAPERAARLWYQAGVLLQDQLAAPDRACEALMEATARDPDVGDALTRLASLVPAHGDAGILADILAERIARGGSRERLTELHVALAELEKGVGQIEAAKRNLGAAAALTANPLDLLRQLYELCHKSRDSAGAIVALEQMAAAATEPVDLRAIYLRLAELRRRGGEPERARQSLQRVLELFPNDAETRERLRALT